MVRSPEVVITAQPVKKTNEFDKIFGPPQPGTHFQEIPAASKTPPNGRIAATAPQAPTKP